MTEVAAHEARSLLTGRQRRRLKEGLLGYLYISPATAILLAFHLLPVLYALYISLHKWKIVQGDYIGLQNYYQVLQESAFWQSLKVTVFYVLGTVPITLAISLLLAYLLFQNVRGRDIYRTLFFLPYITSTVASSAVWVWVFNPKHGPLNQMLEAIGIAPQKWMLEPRGIFQILGQAVGIDVPSWAAGPSQALVAIMVFVIWFYVGWDTVIFLAGLGNIPSELYDAARIDGAGRWALFRHITLPLLSPTIFFLTTMALIGSFQAFSHIFVMTRAAGGQLGGPLRTTTTTSILMFDRFYSRVRFGYASAIAFLLFVTILGLTLLQQRFGRERVFYQ
jgi:multiple sugar transport system permease protein